MGCCHSKQCVNENGLKIKLDASCVTILVPSHQALTHTTFKSPYQPSVLSRQLVYYRGGFECANPANIRPRSPSVTVKRNTLVGGKVAIIVLVVPKVWLFLRAVRQAEPRSPDTR